MMVLNLRPIAQSNRESSSKKYIRWFGYFLWGVIFVLAGWLVVKFFT